jgi:hypothetical protein
MLTAVQCRDNDLKPNLNTEQAGLATTLIGFCLRGAGFESRRNTGCHDWGLSLVSSLPPVTWLPLDHDSLFSNPFQFANHSIDTMQSTYWEIHKVTRSSACNWTVHSDTFGEVHVLRAAIRSVSLRGGYRNNYKFEDEPEWLRHTHAANLYVRPVTDR